MRNFSQQYPSFEHSPKTAATSAIVERVIFQERVP